MLEVGDTVPELEAPMATPEAAAATQRGNYTSDDVAAFRLSDALEAGPVSIATFPGVFSRTCTRELCEMRDWTADLETLPGDVYGLSADTPWSQLAFVDEYDLSYPLVSGFNNDAIEALGVPRTEGLLRGIADRALFVVGSDREVTYTWHADEPLTFPDLDAVEEALATAEDG